MKFTVDEYAHLDSPLHRWDPRFKLIGFMALIFAFSFVSELWMLPAMALLTICILVISGLPPTFILTRLRYPSFFLLFLVILLPFVSGTTVVVSLGPLDMKEEGLIAVLLIVTRFACILTIGLVLFGTAPFLTTIKAMRALGLPAVLTDMILLTFRYLFEIGDYLHRMETSLKLRGFQARRFSLRGLGILAWLGGSILVRSYERSEWIYKAMIVRGYGQNGSVRHEFKARSGDVTILALFLLVAAACVVGDMLI